MKENVLKCLILSKQSTTEKSFKLQFQNAFTDIGNKIPKGRKMKLEVKHYFIFREKQIIVVTVQQKI